MLAESHDVPAMVDAVTDYIARRMIEREHALVVPTTPKEAIAAPVKRRGGFWTFVLGFILGIGALFGAAMLMSIRGI